MDNTLIIGLGKTGLSCVRYLMKQGIKPIVVDDRNHPPGLDALKREYPHIKVIVGGFDATIIEGAKEVIVSPGVPLSQLLSKFSRCNETPVVGDIELFARKAHAPVVAITGSNGKSTVTTLLALMAEHAGLNVRVGGNLGTPALELLEENEPDLYVLELSSFQLESTYSLNAATGVILNISPDHMNRYPDIEAYIAAKKRIYSGDGTIVVNRDATNIKIPKGRKMVSFGLSEPKDGGFGVQSIAGIEWLVYDKKHLMPAGKMQIAGRHNIANALAALALGVTQDLPMPSMLAALCSFRGIPHRLELIAEKDNIMWYNDSKATNIGACIAALEGLGKRSVLIAGGDGKGADFSLLGPAVANHARAVILLGADAGAIARVIPSKVRVKIVATLAAAVESAKEMALSGDAVLLAPACASFDMFSSYEERGSVFKQLVLDLVP